MKLITAAAIVGAANAADFSIQSFIAKAQKAIFQPKENGKGFTFSMEPYISTDCDVDERTEEDEFGEPIVTFMATKCKGKIGNVEGKQNDFQRFFQYDANKKSLNVIAYDKGNTANWWGVQHYMPVKYQNSNFEVTEKLNAVWNAPNIELVHLKKGSFDKFKNMKVYSKTRVTKAGLKQGEYMAEIKLNGQVKLPGNLDKLLNPFNFKSTAWNFKLKFNAAQDCVSNPTSEDCTLGGKISGTAGNLRMHHGLDYKVEGLNKYAILVTTFRKNKGDKVRAVRLDINQPLITLRWEQDKPSYKSILLAQVPHTEMLPEIQKAGFRYIAPFMHYGTAALSDANTTAHAVVWIDQRFATLTTEFDCSNFVASTKIESEWLAQYQGWESVQSFLQGKCEALNEVAVNWLQKEASPKIDEARTYVHDLTGPKGEQKYLVWFARNFPARAKLLV